MTARSTGTSGSIGNTITGSIVNGADGTLSSAFGIQLLSVSSGQPATVEGDINNAGTVTASYSGISVGSGTVDGAVINSGTITATQNGIQLINLASTPSGSVLGTGGAARVNGGITNSGTITSSGSGSDYAGIALDGGMVTNGITNSATGKITAINGAGILLSNTGQFLYTSGTLNTSLGGPSSVSGSISNQGTITARTGIVVTGASTVDMIVNTGTITGTHAAIDLSGAGAAATIDQNGGSISGDILLSPHADILNIAAGTISGNIIGQGPGTVNFALGSGTFAYTNAITGVSAVNINSGTVYDNNVISATMVTVNGGTLAPGQSGQPGSLAITGNVTFTAGGNYLITFNQASASKINATGTAALGGASVGIGSGSTFAFGKTYTILTVAGGVTGAFDPNVANSAHSVTATLAYDSQNAYLTPSSTMTAALPAGRGGNQFNVAQAIDAYANTGDTLPAGFQDLYGLTSSQLQGALAQLAGEAGTGLQQSSYDSMDSFIGLMLDPYATDRSGGFGSATGRSSGEVLGYAQSEAATPAFAAADRATAAALATPKIGMPDRWNFWSSAFGDRSRTGGNTTVVGSHKTTSDSGGFAVGGDYQLSTDTLLGFAVAGGGTSWSLSSGLGGGNSTAFQLGSYGIKQMGPAYVSAALAFSDFQASTHRTVTVGSSSSLNADFNAQSFGGRLESGYRLTALAPVILTPYAAVQVQGLSTPAYSERVSAGSSPFALSYDARTGRQTRVELGSWIVSTLRR